MDTTDTTELIEEVVHFKDPSCAARSTSLVIWEMLSNSVVIDETLLKNPQLKADSKSAEPRGRQMELSQSRREAASTLHLQIRKSLKEKYLKISNYI